MKEVFNTLKTAIMKRSYLVYLLAMLLPYYALGYDFIADNVCYNITSEENLTCEVTYNENKDDYVWMKFYKGVVNIPEKVAHNGKEYTVTAIGMGAFKRSNELLEVIMPNTITTINYEAFDGCHKLKSLRIPKNVQTIKNSFVGLPSLENLSVDEENRYYDSRQGCNAIIKTESSTLLIGCKSTVIPDGVKVIGDCAFLTCWGRHQEDEEAEIELFIPKSVEVIEQQAFAGCDNLKKITFSEGLKSIGHRAFNGTAIESIVIPASVTDIANGAFMGCDSLKSIKVKRGNKVYDSRKKCNAIIETATSKLISACVTTSIPNSVKTIGTNAFTQCKMKEIEIPSSVELIEYNAFTYCKELKNLVIPGNVKTIGMSAFDGCGIETLTVEEGVEQIQIGAFWFCTKLEKATLPASLKKIGSEYGGIFQACRKLEQVKIGDNVTYYCNGSVLIDKATRTIIDGWGTGNCYTGNGLVNLRAKKIGERAFVNHDLLTKVVLPKELEEIRQEAFMDCKGLRVIECRAVVPPLLGKDVFKQSMSNNSYELPIEERTVLVVPTGSLDTYREAPGWKEFKHIREQRPNTH